MIHSNDIHHLRVLCLCAQWCNTCTSYQETFSEVCQLRNDVNFTWLDIEDDCSKYPSLETIDVENFPTLLLAKGSEIVFYGTVLPHKDTLLRLIRSYFPEEDLTSDKRENIQTSSANTLPPNQSKVLHELLHELTP